MDNAERQSITQAVRTYLARERISREEFARRTKLGKSTVDKLVTGLFSEKTVIQVETHTKLALLGSARSKDMAADEFGHYSRTDVQPYCGTYTFGRPSFREKNVIEAHAMEFTWNDAQPCLIVRECEPDADMPAQLGRVYLPRDSRHVFILSNENGLLGQIILSRIDVHKTMKGVMLTMGPVCGNVYNPVAMPVFMRKRDTLDRTMHGEIPPGHAMYGDYRGILASIEAENFARWMGIS